MDLVFFAISLVLYLVAAASFVTHLMVVRETPWRMALSLMSLAFGFHTVALSIHTIAVGSFVFYSLYDQLSLLSWLVVGLYLALQLRYHLAVLGALISPLAFLLTLSAYMSYSGVRELPSHLKSAWLPAHVAPAFLGYATFAVAFCISVVYLVQEKQLKGKRRGTMLRRLPPLETLDELNYRFVAWGFALFTLGILTGSMLAKAEWGEFWSSEPVQIMSGLTWLLYGLLLHMRSLGWRGRRAAALTIAGFALLVVSYISVNLIVPGRHGGTFG